MHKFIVTAASALLFCICIFFVMDMVIGDTTHTDNRASLDRSGKTAISKAVNVGTLRAEEEIAVNPEKAKEEFDKAYKENTAFRDPAAKRDYNIHVTNGKPAMIAVEGDVETGSYLKTFSEQKGSVKSKSRNEVIYEAVAKTKRIGGNVK
ncbi:MULTISPECIES: hypothetical protein [unclassified Bacillus (in: firmicutes)]|uniref:hypothetical protein n=1 Tax=unclassified Bacillus (in: firmicutes) TaxID=185979 RepID=UPI000BF46037|nr:MULTISPECIES: hypothetical protein [unclassified Bacillus (in: firmicutes)]PEU18109.1 hypothetical protein CN525_12890 [Bacillus sp. AFS014408]PFW62378.1 hypothetical protein COL20_13100 [Bacillus sp. AFS075034]